MLLNTLFYSLYKFIAALVISILIGTALKYSGLNETNYLIISIICFHVLLVLFWYMLANNFRKNIKNIFFLAPLVSIIFILICSYFESFTLGSQIKGFLAFTAAMWAGILFAHLKKNHSK